MSHAVSILLRPWLSIHLCSNHHKSSLYCTPSHPSHSLTHHHTACKHITVCASHASAAVPYHHHFTFDVRDLQWAQTCTDAPCSTLCVSVATCALALCQFLLRPVLAAAGNGGAGVVTQCWRSHCVHATITNVSCVTTFIEPAMRRFGKFAVLLRVAACLCCIAAVPHCHVVLFMCSMAWRDCQL